jgi:hypothetical protein
VPLLHCPNCDTIVKADWVTCHRCLIDLRTRPPVTHQGGEPGVAGVLGWVANIIGNLTILIFCVLPTLLVIVGFFVLLFAR